MSGWLSRYTVQNWLESAPQGYLMGTEHGHAPLEEEPAGLLEDAHLRERAVRATGQLVVVKRRALATSAELVNLAPDDASKLFFATQTLDQARHLEVLRQRLRDLGVGKHELESAIESCTSPNLDRFTKILLEGVSRGELMAAVVGHNILLSGVTFHVFGLMRAANEAVNPKLAHSLAGMIADEERHASFGEQRLAALLRDHPDRKPELERMQEELSGLLLAAVTEAARDAPSRDERLRMRERVVAAAGGVVPPAVKWQDTEIDSLDSDALGALLTETIREEFRRRLTRLGLGHRAPARP